MGNSLKGLLKAHQLSDSEWSFEMIHLGELKEASFDVCDFLKHLHATHPLKFGS